MNKRVVSGIQPTGNLHLGNYLGAIRNWVRMQDAMGAGDECLFFLADLHAITVYNEPAALKANIREMAAAVIAWRSARKNRHSSPAPIASCIRTQLRIAPR